jgi:hypothetical protein
MKSKSYLYLPILLLLVLLGCKKNDPANNTGTVGSTGTTGVTGTTGSTGTTINGLDIYVAGCILAHNGHYVAAYWKNGIIKKLSDSTTNCRAYNIAVNGGDVYVIGQFSDDPTVGLGNQIACWKNGVMTRIGQGYASAIVVQGTNVYIAGAATTQIVGGGYATYWKNGVPTTLPVSNALSSMATAIAVNGSDVYVTGNISALTGDNIGVCWKNNVISNLMDNNIPSEANNLLISGNDVYVCGSNSAKKATYWKNGVATVIGSAAGGKLSSAYSIAINGTDLYVSGYEGTLSREYTTYWKNSIETTFTSLGGSTFLQTIPIGTDIYTVQNYDDNPGYQKNGALIKLSNSTGGGSAIAIVQH